MHILDFTADIAIVDLYSNISGFPPLQGGIKGRKSDLRVLQGVFLEMSKAL